MKTNKLLAIKGLVLFPMILVIFIFPGCVTTRPEQRERARGILNRSSEAFQQQARLQYGESAQVRNISTIMGTQMASMGPTARRFATYNLSGTVRIGRGESFDAQFLSAENRIISNRNYDAIVESLSDFFSPLELDIFMQEYSTPTHGAYLFYRMKLRHLLNSFFTVVVFLWL